MRLFEIIWREYLHRALERLGFLSACSTHWSIQSWLAKATTTPRLIVLNVVAFQSSTQGAQCTAAAQISSILLVYTLVVCNTHNNARSATCAVDYHVRIPGISKILLFSRYCFLSIGHPLQVLSSAGTHVITRQSAIASDHDAFQGLNTACTSDPGFKSSTNNTQV